MMTINIAQIFAMDVPWTNGYIEGCNNKTKVVKRVSYGMRNFNNFRKRILFCNTYNRAGAKAPARSENYFILALPQLLT